ncbi:MAG TPA: hypothetical protein VG826_10010 [Pirellulales bacterium]|nr:hypothetical protein [Pirellulales bacterium]
MPSFCQSGQWLVVAALHATVVGCGASGGPARVAVRGEVDVGGREAPDGTISFLPLNAGGGPAATTSVKAGRFQFDGKHGPSPGRHRVLVVSAASSKQQRFGADGAAAVGSEQGASPQERWQTEVDVPNETSCELPIHLK